MTMNRRRSWGERIVTLAALAAIVAGAVAGCTGRQSEARIREAEEKLASQAILVKSADVVTATRERLESGVAFTGELAPVDAVTVGARFDGDLEDVYVREGDRVRRGQAMGRFMPRDVQNARQVAEASVAAAEAGLAAATNAERRVRRLHEAGAASPSDLEAAASAQAAAEAQLRAARAQLDVARENAEKAAMPAEISGWISRVFVHAGDHVVSGDPLVTIVRRDTLELSATIPAEALGRVKTGDAITVRVDAFPGESFAGILDRINPTTEPGTRQVRLYTQVPNTDGKLIGGLFASGRVIEEVKEGAVVAPVEVLRREGGEQVVYRIRQGVAQRVRVATGVVDEQRGRIELTEGVAADDSLLAGVVPGLRDGSRVRVLANGNGPVAESPEAAESAASGSGAAAAGE